MNQTRLGDAVLLIGGIQVALVVVVWFAALDRFHQNRTWFAAISETSLFWIFLVWSGAVLLLLGYSLRSGDLQATDYPRSRGAVVQGAAIVGVLGLISTALIAVPFAIY